VQFEELQYNKFKLGLPYAEFLYLDPTQAKEYLKEKGVSVDGVYKLLALRNKARGIFFYLLAVCL
jgi:hypothetical protein